MQRGERSSLPHSHKHPTSPHNKTITQQAFLYYDGGIIDDDDCFAMPFATAAACAASVDHTVLLIGYDTDTDTGMDYW